MSALNAELASPRVVNDAIVGGVRHVDVEFSNERQMQQWLAEQRTAGFDVKIQRRQPPQSAYFTQPFKVELKFGGLEGLRAIAYIALTFLAHYFPKVARQAGLRAFKDFVLGDDKEQPVWWDFRALPDDIPSNSFRFGHRILIGLSAERQEAYARVSLFSTLEFAAHFGEVRVASDETVIVDIDPQSEQHPFDISEIREQKSMADVDRPASLDESLRDTIDSGEGRKRFDRLLRKIFDWQLECIAERLLTEINAAKGLGPHERFRQVKRLVDEHGQCVVNLMKFVVTGLGSQFASNPATAQLAPALELLVAGDTSSASGISQIAKCALELATAALAQRICLDYDEGKLDAQRLFLLIGGGVGASVVGEAILRPFKMALGITE